MGYTHYWTVNEELNDRDWAKVEGIARRVFAKAKADGVCLAGGSGARGSKPKLTNRSFTFNGCQYQLEGKNRKGEGWGDSYETFEFQRRATRFAFCKTEHKPYDAAVVSFLALVKRALKGKVSVSSDGGPRAIKNVLMAGLRGKPAGP